MMNATLSLNDLHVPAGLDRSGQNNLKIWGLIPLSIKVSSKDTDGRLMIFEHTDMNKGGPPRHVHYEQDEWFYVLKGEYAFEIGEQKYRLKSGDSIFAPRMIPHAWACVSEQPGSLMTLLSPAGTFEAFILETTTHKTLPSQEAIEQAFLDHGMKVVGPPLPV